jgi:N-acetylglucosamine-6-sulfatase
MEVMPKLNELLIKGGARMSNAFVATPICCPSRTEFFSGRYYHNIGPPNDPGGCMHVNTANAAKKATGVFGLMVSAGYEVGVFGKVTNDQKGILDLLSSEGSITWSNSPIDYNNFMGTPYYRDYGNGTTGTETIDKKHPVYGTAYQSTQIGNRTLEWLDILKAAGKILPTDDSDGSTDDTTRMHGSHGGKGGSKPFFAYVGPHAPHYPAIPAPWYEHAFDDVTIPITPNYNTSHEDKTQHIRQNPALSDRAHCWQNQVHCLT